MPPPPITSEKELSICQRTDMKGRREEHCGKTLPLVHHPPHRPRAPHSISLSYRAKHPRDTLRKQFALPLQFGRLVATLM